MNADTPMSPKCAACREPDGTCFPGPCKLYEERKAAAANTQTIGDGAGNGTASATSRQPEPREAQNPFSELRGLIERASLLPWKTGMAFPTRIITGEGDERRIVAGTCLPLDEGNPNDIELADAALIVAAVNSLGALLDERDRLIGENERLVEAVHAFMRAGGAKPRQGIVRVSAWSLDKLNLAFDKAVAVFPARSALSDQGEG